MLSANAGVACVFADKTTTITDAAVIKKLSEIRTFHETIHDIALENDINVPPHGGELNGATPTAFLWCGALVALAQPRGIPDPPCVLTAALCPQVFGGDAGLLSHPVPGPDRAEGAAGGNAQQLEQGHAGAAHRFVSLSLCSVVPF